MAPDRESGTGASAIGLAGCGKMGSAMMRAWLDSGLVHHIHVLDPYGLPPEYIAHPSVTYCANEQIFLSFATEWDWLVIAIKPQGMDDFCNTIKTHLPGNLPILSIAAGRTINSFQQHFGSAQPVIRAMPNTPAAIGKAMTAACATSNITEVQRASANGLLCALGMVEWVEDESLLDAITAVSGSGPAYVFYLIETMAAAGVKSGLSQDLALTLARQTVIGAAALAEEMNDLPPGMLRENVTSPNGTTAAALSVLMDGRLQSLMDEAIEKATARSRELSQ